MLPNKSRAPAEGSSMILDCPFTSIPKANITWSFGDSGKISDNRRVLGLSTATNLTFDYLFQILEINEWEFVDQKHKTVKFRKIHVSSKSIQGELISSMKIPSLIPDVRRKICMPERTKLTDN